MNRFLSQRFGLTRSKFRKWIGFSLDEWRRIQRMMTGEEYRKGLIHFPLAQAVPLRRQQAIQRVEKLGWPTPPRSRCWHCPNQQDDEWLSLPPEEFAAAVAFEEEVRKIDPCAFLHEQCVPLSQVDFSREPTLFDAGNYCSSGACFV